MSWAAPCVFFELKQNLCLSDMAGPVFGVGVPFASYIVLSRRNVEDGRRETGDVSAVLAPGVARGLGL